MRSGSSAHDGHSWPSTQHPYPDEATSGPGPYGAGATQGPAGRTDQYDRLEGRTEVPFGPDVSWPQGFRQLDPESRRVLESGYGSGGYPAAPHDQGYGPGRTGATGYGYQSPTMADYGDPGYSDPAYEGPRSQYAGPASPGGRPDTWPPAAAPGAGHGGYGAGYGQAGFGSGQWQATDARGHGQPDARAYGSFGAGIRESDRPGFADTSRQTDFGAPWSGEQDVYPVTGAQEALPDTGPHPLPGFWASRGSASTAAGSSAYPEQRHRDPHPSGPRPAAPPASDPRLAGMRYDELRYDEVSYESYDEPLDDESWYEELRRSAPSYPQSSSGRPPAGQRSADPRPRTDPHPRAHFQDPGDPQAPVREQPPRYRQAHDERTGARMRAGREFGSRPPSEPGGGPWLGAPAQARPAPRPGTSDAIGPSQHAGGFSQVITFTQEEYFEAPAAQVGVLTPPGIPRLETEADVSMFAAAPAATEVLAPAVRPGHGLDGPGITESWPVQPDADELQSYEEFWREDDEDGEYVGLFAERDTGGRDTGSRSAVGRRIGRRRGRSNDRRLWLALAGVVIVAAAAIVGIIKIEFPSHGGPAHVMQTPAAIGSYVLTQDLERQTNVAQLRAEVIKMSSGQASRVVSAVYESGTAAAGSTEQILMFIGGHLANADPATSITTFTQKYPGAFVVSPGPLGGKAACVEEGAGTADSVSMCAWFDNDSFGIIVSPTMNAKSLATSLLTVRPNVEHVVAK
jgi:hypothetical protein